MIKVFYDGACGLCSKEINHYKKIAPKGVFEWCDVMKNPESLDGLGISLAQALKILQAQDQRGRIHQGVDAFLLIWQALPRWRRLAQFTRLPGVYALAKWVYGHFAAWRFKRLSHCQAVIQKEPIQKEPQDS